VQDAIYYLLKRTIIYYSSYSYGASPAIWEQFYAPCNNSSHAGWYSVYLIRRDGRLSLCCSWLYTGMIYFSVGSRPSNAFTWLGLNEGNH